MVNHKLVLFLVALLFVAISYGQVSNLDAIECPFPGGEIDSNQSNCSKLTACEWTSSRCHMRSNMEVGYAVVSGPENTGRGFKMQLTRSNPNLTLYGDDILNLTFEVIYHQDYHVQIKITNYDAIRYEPPVPLNLPEAAGTNPLYQVTVSDVGLPFSFAVLRTSNGNTLYNLTGPLTYENQFIQLTTTLMSSYLYGFGESTHTSFRRQFEPRETCAMFARQQSIGTELMNIYGHHPYYMAMEDDEGNSHSVLFFNSNAMEYSTFLLDDGTPSLTLRTIGGIVDLHFFLGPTPEELNFQYYNLIGLPVFPPYYAFGFHLSRWGYGSTDNVREVRQRMKDKGIPQDVQTLDIDYMFNHRDFTYDPVNWGDLPDLIQELHDDNVKVTVILDPAIVIDWENYPPAERGREVDAFVKWSDPSLIPEDQPEGCDEYIVGYVWPNNKTVFPDFLKPETQDWWINEILLLHQNVSFDILWIDMNEPTNFGTDTLRPWNYPVTKKNWSLKCPNTSLDSPPYPTKTTYSGSTKSNRLSDGTICMSSKHTDNNNTYFHYDVHPLYGLSHMEATHRALQTLNPGERSLVYSRSTFPGSGRNGGHWLGDNSAEWVQMRMSIIGLLEFNMFGIPFVGADVCGFDLHPSDEMCARWTELGAFYPFNRNHNAADFPPQDPGVYNITSGVARDILLLRYQYNPYLYSLFHKAHMDGASVIRPLLNVFPNDLFARDVDDQFMWADGLMIAPVLYKGLLARDVYFPEGKWYDLRNGSLQAVGPQTITAVPAPVEVIPVYVRGGVILPYQEPALTTSESRLNPFGLTIAIGDDAASGEIYWDDGIKDHDMANAFLATLTYNQNQLSLTVDNPSPYVEGLTMNTLAFYGFETTPTSVSVNGVNIDGSSWQYAADTQVLIINLVDVPLGEDLLVQIV